MDKTDIHSVWGGKFTINFFVTYSLPTTEKKKCLSMLQYIFMNRSETIYNTMETVIVSSHSLCLSDFSVSVHHSDRTTVKG